MADVKISALPAAGVITGSELVPIVQGGVTSQSTVDGIKNGAVKVYAALLSQSGTNDPVATILENSLGGTILWTRVGTGKYNGELTGAFLSGKVALFPPGPLRGSSFFGGGVISLFAISRSDNDNIGLWAGTGDVSTTPGSFDVSDDLLTESLVQIRVYP